MQTFSHFLDFLRSSQREWHFDLFSSIVTLVFIPLGLVVLRTASRAVRVWAKYAIDGTMYWLSRSIMHSLASGLSLSKYCRLQLEADTQFLHVPSRFDTKLEVD